MKNIAKYAVIGLFILMLCIACPHNKDKPPETHSGPATSTPSAPYVEGGISLVVSKDKKTINISVKSNNGTPIELEECTAPSIQHNTHENVTAKNRIIILKPQTGADIIELTCLNQSVLEINAEGCSTLKTLTCTNNKLTKLTFHAASALQLLECNKNTLTTLDTQRCRQLKNLKCSENKITGLNFNGLNQLTNADCHKNKLVQLTVTGCANLTELNCSSNELNELDISNLPKIQLLDCGKNNLQQLAVQNCPELIGITCYVNKLTSLDVSNLAKLQTLLCDTNELTAVNITGTTSDLKEIECYDNKLQAEAFTALLNALPDRTSAVTEGKIVLCKKDGESGNITDFTQPADLLAAVNTAKGHNWKLYKKTDTEPGEEI